MSFIARSLRRPFFSMCTKSVLKQNRGVIKTSTLLNLSSTSMFRRALCTEETAASEQERLKGNVKWFDSRKGFGFITPEDGSPDIFVHQTQVHAPGFRNLADGEPVEFFIKETDDGKLRAEHVTGPEGAYVQGAPRPQSRQDDWQF